MTIFNFLLIFITFNLLQAPTWRDIIPLKSTEADVEKIFGKSLADTQYKSYVYYKTKNEEARYYIQ